MWNVNELIERGNSNSEDEYYWIKLYDDCMDFLKDEKIDETEKEKLYKSNMELISMMRNAFLSKKK